MRKCEPFICKKDLRIRKNRLNTEGLLIPPDSLKLFYYSFKSPGEEKPGKILSILKKAPPFRTRDQGHIQVKRSPSIFITFGELLQRVDNIILGNHKIKRVEQMSVIEPQINQPIQANISQEGLSEDFLGKRNKDNFDQDQELTPAQKGDKRNGPEQAENEINRLINEKRQDLLKGLEHDACDNVQVPNTEINDVERLPTPPLQEQEKEGEELRKFIQEAPTMEIETHHKRVRRESQVFDRHNSVLMHSNKKDIEVPRRRPSRSDKKVDTSKEKSIDSSSSSSVEYEEWTSIIFDTSIKRGWEYQAYIPDRHTGNFCRDYSAAIDFEGERLTVVEIENYTRDQGKSNQKLFYRRKAGDKLQIILQPRTTVEYLEWDPSISSKREFMTQCFFLSKFVEENYDLSLSNKDLLEYFQICRMNKDLFCSSICNDFNPFIDFVQQKRMLQRQR